MPTITPPPIDPEELPSISEIEQGEIPYSEYLRIKRFLDVPNWMCPICTATNFGRNKNCAYCFGRRKIITKRPD